jgi:peptidoglycan hydrolase CwlO-like protein
MKKFVLLLLFLALSCHSFLGAQSAATLADQIREQAQILENTENELKNARDDLQKSQNDVKILTERLEQQNQAYMELSKDYTSLQMKSQSLKILLGIAGGAAIGTLAGVTTYALLNR